MKLLTGEILFKTPCKVCGKLIYTIEDKNYPSEPGEFWISAISVDEDGNKTVMCDQGDRDGCMKSYHEKCFDLHQCPVHPKKK